MNKTKTINGDNTQQLSHFAAIPATFKQGLKSDQSQSEQGLTRIDAILSGMNLTPRCTRASSSVEGGVI